MTIHVFGLSPAVIKTIIMAKFGLAFYSQLNTVFTFEKPFTAVGFLLAGGKHLVKIDLLNANGVFFKK